MTSVSADGGIQTVLFKLEFFEMNNMDAFHQQAAQYSGQRNTPSQKAIQHYTTFLSQLVQSH